MTIPTRLGYGVTCRVGDRIEVPVSIVAEGLAVCTLTVSSSQPQEVIALEASATVDLAGAQGPREVRVELYAAGETVGQAWLDIVAKAGPTTQQAGFPIEVAAGSALGGREHARRH